MAEREPVAAAPEPGAGMMAEFDTPEALLAACQHLTRVGFARLESFTPFAVPEVEEVLRLPRSPIAWVVFFAALSGAAFAYAFQYWMLAIDYPLNVGGLPAHSGPAFIPITFETTVLFGGVAAFVSFLLLCRLPRLWDPAFEAHGFETAAVNRFWLAVDARDPQYAPVATAELLRGLGALHVIELSLEERRAPEPQARAPEARKDDS